MRGFIEFGAYKEFQGFEPPSNNHTDSVINTFDHILRVFERRGFSEFRAYQEFKGFELPI